MRVIQPADQEAKRACAEPHERYKQAALAPHGDQAKNAERDQKPRVDKHPWDRVDEQVETKANVAREQRFGLGAIAVDRIPPATDSRRREGGGDNRQRPRNRNTDCEQDESTKAEHPVALPIGNYEHDGPDDDNAIEGRLFDEWRNASDDPGDEQKPGAWPVAPPKRDRDRDGREGTAEQFAVGRKTFDVWRGADHGHQPRCDDGGARPAKRPGNHGEGEHERNAGNQRQRADRPLIAEHECEAVEPEQSLWSIDPGDLAIEGKAACPGARHGTESSLVDVQRHI